MLCLCLQVLGGDVAGVVADAGSSARFKPGDRVFACTDGFLFNTPWGCYSERVNVREEQLAAIPEGISMDQAAGIPLVAMTAWQALAPAMPLEGTRRHAPGPPPPPFSPRGANPTFTHSSDVWG